MKRYRLEVDLNTEARYMGVLQTHNLIDTETGIGVGWGTSTEAAAIKLAEKLVANHPKAVRMQANMRARMTELITEIATDILNNTEGLDA